MIRAATAADAGAIAEIEARAWLWAYSDFIDPEAMHEPYTRSGPWSDYIAAGAVRVFDQDGLVVGYTAIEGGQLKALYVEPAAQGAGVGARLLADSEAWIRGCGHGCAHLFVYAANAHGRAFYERHGWACTGELLGEREWRAPGYRYEKALT